MVDIERREGMGEGKRRTSANRFLVASICRRVPVSMTILAAIHWRQQKLAALWKAHPFTQAGPAGNGFLACSIETEPLRRHSTKSSIARPFLRLSSHSLVILLTLLMVWISMVVGTSLELLLPHGLRVQLIRPRGTTLRSPGIQPLLVYVDGRGISLGSERNSPAARPIGRCMSRVMTIWNGGR